MSANAHTQPASAAWSQQVELVFALIERDQRLLYARSLLGALWAVAQPLMLVGFYAVLMGGILRPGVERQGLFVLAGLLPWLWFSGAVTASAGAFPGNAPLLRQNAFPAELLIVSAVGSHFVTFLLALALLLPLVGSGANSLATLAFLPLLFAIQAAFTVGIGLAVGTGNALWRDVGHIVGVLLRGWFIATPVLYLSSRLPADLHGWMWLNPMAGLVEAYQSVLCWGQPPQASVLLGTSAFAAATLLLGLAAFSLGRHRIPEEV